jgi:hypothetical protein
MKHLVTIITAIVCFGAGFLIANNQKQPTSLTPSAPSAKKKHKSDCPSPFLTYLSAEVALLLKPLMTSMKKPAITIGHC